MSDTKKKQYTVEFESEEAEQIEDGAKKQGISATDFVIYCTRQACFGVIYAINKLAETGQVGTDQDKQ
jgi:hypothetical protein